MKYEGNENRFKLDGKWFVAVDGVDGCEDCFFEGFFSCTHVERPHCTKSNRRDNEAVIFIEEKQKEKEMERTFNVEINGKGYEVKKFNLIDIYKAGPCSGEFIKLMEEWGEECLYPTEDWIENGNTGNTELGFENFPTLKNNISWLIEKEFMTEIKKETKLKPGMVLTRDLGAEYFCVKESGGVSLVCTKEDSESMGVGEKYLNGSIFNILEEIHKRQSPQYRFYIK